MNKPFVSYCFLVLSIIIFSSSSWGQGSIMWRKPVSRIPLANVGSSGGQYYDPQYSPLSSDWLSFEVDRERERALYMLDLKHQTRYEIGVGKKPGANENIFDQTNVTTNSFAGELAWCPQKIEGKQWFAFVGSAGSNEDIYLGNTDDLAQGLSKYYRVTNDPFIDDEPQWSPDGKQLMFISKRSGRSDIYRITDVPELIKSMREGAADNQPIVGELIGNGKWINRTTESPDEEIFPTWSPDGNYIAYTLLNFGNGDSSGSQLMLKDIAQGKLIKLFGEKSRILRNASFSPDGRFVACYDAGTRQEETVDLIVFQVLFSDSKITGAKVKWTKDNVRRFESVKSRVHGGPYWAKDGSLYFLNEIKSPKNSVLRIPSESFLQSGRPTTQTFIIVGDRARGSIELNIRDIDFAELAEQEPPLVLAAQEGNLFGIYTDAPPVPDTPRPQGQDSFIAGISSGILRYRGDAKDSGFTAGVEISARYPISDDISITGTLGFGNVQGFDLDANDRRWSFVSSIYYLNVMPTLHILSAGPVSLFAEGGLGGGYVNSKRDKTKGFKVLVPLGLEADFNILAPLKLMVRGGYTFSSGDLDGLHLDDKKDDYFGISIGVANLISLPTRGN